MRYIFLFVALLFLIGIVAEWGGRCKKCGSWRNWRSVLYLPDDHRPNLIIEQRHITCRACRNVVLGKQTSRPKPELPHY